MVAIFFVDLGLKLTKQKTKKEIKNKFFGFGSLPSFSTRNDFCIFKLKIKKKKFIGNSHRKTVFLKFFFSHHNHEDILTLQKNRSLIHLHLMVSDLKCTVCIVAGFFFKHLCNSFFVFKVVGKIMLAVDHRDSIIEDNIHHSLVHSNGILDKDLLDSQDNGNTIDILHRVNNHLIHLYNR